MQRSAMGIPTEIKLTRFKSNNPINPQLTDPINTIISDNLSNMFNLHIAYHSLKTKILNIYIWIKNTIITKS